MEFHEHPEDPDSTIIPSSRKDEIGLAQRELALMQVDLRASLQQRDRLATLGTAVSKISHDLRNILATAQLISDRIANSTDPDVRRVTPTLVRAIDRAVDLCSNTLSFVGHADGKIHRREFDLCDLVEDVGLSMGLSDDGPVKWFNEVDAPFLVLADREKIFRALFNIGRNAVQAIQGKEDVAKGKVSVAAIRENSVVSVDVTDNGPGLPEGLHESLFQAFVKSERKDSTGLGLVIARDIARAHGGDVRLMELSPLGTRFRHWTMRCPWGRKAIVQFPGCCGPSPCARQRVSRRLKKVSTATGPSGMSVATEMKIPTARKVPIRSRKPRYQGVEDLSWDPTQYLKFSDLRLRPAFDLLARVAIEPPKEIIDLGCGTGMVTAVLSERWPKAHIIGVDESSEMLDKARQDAADIEWQEAGVENWAPQFAPDLIVSNSVLHWLDDHDRLFPRLAGMLAAGGVLAVQMPKNFAAPSHTCISHAVEAGPWQEKLTPLNRPDPVALPSDSHDLLISHAASVDIWEIEYYQVLRGNSPVVEWTSGTILRPILSVPTENERIEFLQIYEQCVANAYPPQPDGTTLFPFKRLFIVAQV